MYSIEPDELRAAVQARDIAAAYYLMNPRVRLIDVGYKITDGQYTGEFAVRVHLVNKPEQAVFEAFSIANEDLVIDKSKIPFQVDLIQADYQLHWSWPPPRPENNRSRYHDPLRGGISVSSEWLYGYGTLGGIVLDGVTGDPMILSNWHVLAGSAYAPRGLSVYQPGYGDGGNYTDTVASLERHAMDQDIDAAVARLTGNRGWINDQLEIGPVNGSRMPAVGDESDQVRAHDKSHPRFHRRYHGRISHPLRRLHHFNPPCLSHRSTAWRRSGQQQGQFRLLVAGRGRASGRRAALRGLRLS